MLPQRMKKAVVDNPKKVADLISLVNLPETLREFVGQSQISRLGCFMRVWSYIKTNNLQDPNNKNVINCDEKLKKILLDKPRVELVELPELIKYHFPKKTKILNHVLNYRFDEKWMRSLTNVSRFHFWAPTCKWVISIANIADFSKPPELISYPQQAAVTATGLIWSRYSMVITPKNWNLFSVNVAMAATGLYQISRKIKHDYLSKADGVAAKE